MDGILRRTQKRKLVSKLRWCCAVAGEILTSRRSGGRAKMAGQCGSTVGFKFCCWILFIAKCCTSDSSILVYNILILIFQDSINDIIILPDSWKQTKLQSDLGWHWDTLAQCPVDSSTILVGFVFLCFRRLHILDCVMFNRAWRMNLIRALNAPYVKNHDRRSLVRVHEDMDVPWNVGFTCGFP